MIKKTLSMCLLGLLAGAQAASAADWLNIPDLTFTKRQALTVENPAGADSDSVLVHLPINLPADRVAVAPLDPRTGIDRDKVDQYFIPFQVDGNILTFALPLKAGEKQQLWLYSSDAPVIMPGFAAKTAYDSRQAYRSFENDLMAFRIESGSGANTTGMTIDTFGKTAAGRGLRLVELYQTGHDAYHVMSYWGIDTLQVGSSPGLGGVYIYVGDQVGRAAAADIMAECLHEGPVETVVRFTAPVQVAGRNFTLIRTLTLWANERGIGDVVEIKGDNLDGVQLGLGLRNLPNQTWTEKPAEGYAFVAGDANQRNYKSVGLGAAFNPAQFDRIVPLSGNNGGHVYLLNPQRQGDTLVSRHHLASIWDGDGQINNPADFDTYLQKQAKLLLSPAKVELSNQVETR